MFGINKRFVAIGAAAILAVTTLGTAAFAANTPPTATPSAASAPAAATPGATTTAPRTNYQQVFVDKLAAELGISSSDLVAKIKQAAIDTINQAVANGDVARNPADTLIQRIQQSTGIPPLGVGFGLGDHDRGFGPGHRGAPVVDAQAVMQAVADKLGMTVADLQTQLRSGATLASLAQSKSLNVQDLYDAAANAAKPSLDQAVKDGRLTQAQADQIYQQLQQGKYVLQGARGAWGRGPAGSGAPSTVQPTATPSTTTQSGFVPGGRGFGGRFHR